MILDFSIVFSLKLIFVVIAAVVFYGKLQRMAESFVCGWLVIYEGQIVLMLILSAFHRMNRTGLMIGAGCALIMMLALYQRFGSKQYLRGFFRVLWNKVCQTDTIGYIFIGGLLLLSVYMIGHNILFFDSTWDAHTYQVARIELFVQKESLFVNMKSDSINIFSNEWNGELNAIFYAILCGTNQGMFLANAENFIYSLLVVYWFCIKIGITESITRLTMILYCSMPQVIFLAMVVKGDFVAIPFFLAAVIWLKDYIETRSIYALFFLIAGGSLAAGSKISMVPFAGLCFVSVAVFIVIENKGKLIHILQYLTGIWKMLLTGIICAFVGCSRYFLNFLFYGEFFKRVDLENEKIGISWQYITTSMTEMVKTLICFDNMITHEGNVDAINLDMGVAGCVFALFFLPTVMIWVFKCKNIYGKRNSKQIYMWFPIAGSLLFFMSSTIWLPWSFRYYMPWVLTLFFYWVLMLQDIFFFFFHLVTKLAVSTGVWLGIIGVVSTIVMTMKYGEVTHSTWREAKQKSMIEREYGFHPYLLESYDGSPDIYDFFDQMKSGKKILICNAVNTAITYLFGEDNSNDVTFCIPEEVFIKLAEEEYDVVSISDVFLTQEIETYFGNSEWVCYTPCKDIVQAHVYIHVQ